MAEGKIKIKLVGSPIGRVDKQKRIIRSIGLRKMQQVVELPDTPGTRGVVRKVPHLLAIIEE